MKKNKKVPEKGNRNKAFIIFSILTVAIAFGALIINNSPELKQDPESLVNPTTLIREHSYSKGPADAKVTIVEFFDPECEACRATHPILNGLYNEYSGKIRIVYRYTPFHTNSVYASSVLEEAREHGKFEEALSILFKNQPVWGSHHDPRPELIPDYMEKIGLARNLFDRDIVIAKHKAKIELDQKDGRELLVELTPTFFVNGRKLNSIGYVHIKAAIDESLR